MTKTALITGASSGIGNATAKLFHAKGWNVIATMRDPSKGTELDKLDRTLLTRLDVSDVASIEAAVAAGIARFGAIDALINNAGYGVFGVFEAASREKIQQQFDVNVFGVMDTTRTILPHFRARRSGMIVNVGSGAGIFTMPTISLYSASKFALHGFTEALSFELNPLGIGVKLVSPIGGVSSTAFQGRMAQEFAGQAPSDYEPFLESAGRAFASMVADKMMTAEDVADVVYSAVTDGSDKLRYIVGLDHRGFLKAQTEMPYDDYLAHQRDFFAKF
jgi:NAD(P)-dependent dehydrogenase (short-subunit alcohol dehydrogenase family)